MNGRPTTCALALGLFIFVVLTYEAGASNTAQPSFYVSSGPGKLDRYYVTNTNTSGVLTLTLPSDRYHLNSSPAPTINVVSIGKWSTLGCSLDGVAVATDYIYFGLICPNERWFGLVECSQWDPWGACTNLTLVESSATEFNASDTAPRAPFEMSQDGTQMISRLSDTTIGVYNVSREGGFTYQTTLTVPQGKLISMTNKYNFIGALTSEAGPTYITYYNTVWKNARIVNEKLHFQTVCELNRVHEVGVVNVGTILAFRNDSVLAITSNVFQNEVFDYNTCGDDGQWIQRSYNTYKGLNDPSAIYASIPCSSIAFGVLYKYDEVVNVSQDDMERLAGFDCAVGASNGGIHIISPDLRKSNAIGGIYPTAYKEPYVYPIEAQPQFGFNVMASPSLIAIISDKFTATAVAPAWIRTLSVQPPGYQSCFRDMYPGCSYGRPSDYVGSCLMGYYNPAEGLTPCLPCPAGSYVPFGQATTCLPCPDGMLCPAGSVRGLSSVAAIDTAERRRAVYPFPLRANDKAATLSAQGLIVNGLFVSPNRIVGKLFFYLTISSLGVIALLAVLLCVVSVKRPSYPLVRFLRQADIFKHVHYRSDNRTFAVHKSPVGAMLLLALLVIFLLSFAFIVQLYLNFVPLYLSDQFQANATEAEIPQNNLRSATLYSVAGVPPSTIHPQLLHDIKTNTRIHTSIIYDDVACIDGEPNRITIVGGCLARGYSGCHITKYPHTCRGNKTSLWTSFTIEPPHVFAGGFEINMPTPPYAIGRVNVTISIEDTARNETEKARVGDIIPSRVERIIQLPDADIMRGGVLSGDFDIPITMSYTIRQTEIDDSSGAAPKTEAYIALTMEEAPVVVPATVKDFVQYPPTASNLNIHITVTESPVWTLEKESRIVHWADALVAVVLMAITAFNVARVIGAVEKRILAKMVKEKQDDYEPLAEPFRM